METLVAYWTQQFQTMTPESFWADSTMGYQPPPGSQRTSYLLLSDGLCIDSF